MAELPIVVGDDAAAAAAIVADRLVAEFEQIRAKGRAAPVLGWPVGRTPRAVIAALAARGDTVMDDVHVVLMDEFAADGAAVPLQNPVSCQAAALRELVAPLAAAGLDATRVHSPDPTQPEEHERLIAELGGVDLFLVAVGASDGHVALNPPGSSSRSRTRMIRIADSTRRDNMATFGLAGLEQVPEWGITVGLATIADARRLVVFAHGAHKRGVVQRLVDAPGFDPRLPVSIVLEHPAAVLVCDRASAPEVAR